MPTKLDQELAGCISPLVSLNARLAVSPHVNTLCLAYHFRLALGDHWVVNDQIKLMDWNIDVSSGQFLAALTGGNVTGFYVFYSTKDIAARLKQWRQPGGGYYNSLPVTRYRQRYIFLRRTASNEAFLKSHEGERIGEVAAELFTERVNRRKPFILTDILGQAKAVARTVSKPRDIPIIYPSSPLGDPDISNDDFALFVYSGPSTEYMVRTAEHFIALNIDDLPTTQDDAYETHVVWHMPESSKPDDRRTVALCLRAYHERLFKAAQASDVAEFGGMSDAISLTLTARHPSFGSTVFRNATDFRQCLLDHHSDPPGL
jgi:hypothetical protein